MSFLSVAAVLIMQAGGSASRMLSREKRRHQFHRSNSLTLFILASLLFHTVVLVLGDRLFNVKPFAPQPQPQALIPIDYVEIPPEAASKTPSETTPYRASHASQAGGEAQPKRPVSVIESSEGRRVASSSTSTPPISTPTPQGDRSQTSVAPVAQSPISSATRTPTQISPSQPQPSQPVRQSVRQPAALTSPGAMPTVRESDQAIAGSPGISAQSNPRPVRTNQAISSPTARPANPSQTVANSNQRSPNSNRGAAGSAQPTGPSARDLLSLSGNALTSTPFNSNRSSSRLPGVDAGEDADLAPYLDALKEAVRQQWVRSPTHASRRTVVEFVVTRSGQISSPQIIQSSGSEAVDREAQAAIRRAAPFAPLPNTYSNEALMIHFGFTINVYGDMAIDGN